MNAAANKTETYLWSQLTRRLASVAIIFYLGVVVLGPLTVPSGSPQLTNPMAEKVAPLQQALFLGHGYRFFGPDPGPSHSVIYEVTDAAGNITQGHFPDRDQTWPRLLYHRWFMLSESIYRDAAGVPNDQTLDTLKQTYQQTMDEVMTQGKLKLRQQLARERDIELAGIEAARAKRELLIRAVAQHLLQRHQGESIRLLLQERSLPTPEEVANRIPLDDPQFIQQFELGRFTAAELSDEAPLKIRNFGDPPPVAPTEQIAPRNSLFGPTE